MTNNTNNTNETVTLKSACGAFSSQKVSAMVRKIEDSFERRDAFEASQGLDLNTENSYTRERARMVANTDTDKTAQHVARFFLALDLEPSKVIERKVSENAMFNAKALKKVRELARYAVLGRDGDGVKLERVMKAFIACTIIATRRGHDVVTNKINVNFLNGHDLSKIVTDQDTLDALDKLSDETSRHAAMSSGAATQSSQARNVLDVLKAGRIAKVDRERDAIALNLDHMLIEQFASDYMTA